MLKSSSAIWLSVLLLFIPGCGPFTSWQDDQKTAQRVQDFPTQGLDLKAPARIYFDEHQIPFIEAGHDDDLPYLLGMVHAHLRLAQMEVFRRAAQGRLTEMFGPFVSKVDHSLRILNLTKAVPQMARDLPPRTRLWLERFSEGINHYSTRAARLSPEMEILGLEHEPWSVEDVLCVGRMAAADVNWLFWFGALRMKDQKAWAELWTRIKKQSQAGPASFPPGQALPQELLSGAVKSGSNCVAVAPSRSQSGGAILANDAHVGLNVPAMWLLVGYKSPSLQVLGYTVPGAPLVLMGRNKDIAWGGTNMLSLSSSLYDISGPEYDGGLTRRTEKLKVRWWLNREVEVRESEYGQVVTDSPYFEELGLGRLALKWRGHQPSDEVSAFMAVNRARDWPEFRAAFESYAVSGQNMLYADHQGNIGQVMAIEFTPAAGRTGSRLVGDPKQPDQLWQKAYKSTELPAAYNPESGFLASSNNAPVKLNPPLSLFARGGDRFRRIGQLMEKWPKLGVEELKKLQLDTYGVSSHRLAKAIVKSAQGLQNPPADLLAALSAWDGRYDVDSNGAAALELSAYHLVEELYRERYGPELAEYIAGMSSVYDLISDDLEQGDQSKALAAALKQAAQDHKEHATWGSLHYLRISHIMGNAPLIGSRFRYGELPYPGSSRTLMKSAHSLQNQKHYARYGANARFIADMSSPDENYFALLGGQDGYFGSDNYLDMAEKWKKGEFIKVPMSLDKIEKQFQYKLELKPKP